MVQDFDRRSNPNCPFNHAQANLTTHEQRRRLHEKFFAPVDFLLQRRALRKIKEISSLCLWPQSFFPSFFLFFFHVSPSHCQTQNRFGHVPGKIENLPMYRNLHCPTVGAIGPTVGASWLHRSSSFRNFANFLPRTNLFAPKQSLKTWLFKTPAKT